VNCCRAVLPLMKAAGGGTIINLVGAGVGWKVFQPGKTAYITSKFAVYGFTEALAREVEDANIRVNALSPGSVDTCLRDGLVDDAQRRRVRENAEDLSPDAAARMVSFLVSEKCGPLTGKIISARWDDPDILAAQSQQLNNRCLMTLRKIDGRNYLESPADL
ncbi:MAG: SDR family oxidoreductase, partial [Rhodospirillales bacterium]